MANHQKIRASQNVKKSWWGPNSVKFQISTWLLNFVLLLAPPKECVDCKGTFIGKGIVISRGREESIFIEKAIEAWFRHWFVIRQRISWVMGGHLERVATTHGTSVITIVIMGTLHCVIVSPHYLHIATTITIAWWWGWHFLLIHDFLLLLRLLLLLVLYISFHLSLYMPWSPPPPLSLLL